MGRTRRTLRIVFTDGFRAEPLRMTVTAVTMLIATVAGITYPVGIRTMVDAMTRHSVSGEVAGMLLAAVLFSVAWALQIVSAVQGTMLSDRISVWTSARFARLVNAAPWLELYERPDHLSELELLDERCQMLAEGPRQVLNLLSVTLRTVGIGVLLAMVYLPLVFLPLVGLAPYLGDKRSVRLRERSDEAMASRRRLADELYDLAAAAEPAKELRIYGLRDELRRRHAELTAAASRSTVRAAVRGALWSGLGWLVYAAGFAGVIAVIAVRAVRGEASPGQVVLAVSLLRRAQLSVPQMTDGIGKLVATAQTARRMIWLEDYVAAARRQSVTATATVPDRLTDGLVVEGLRLTYPGTDALVLDDVNLRLPAGATVAVVGENGSGKTTFVKLLAGMYRPTGGRILADGVDLAAIPVEDWRARTSAVFQDFVQWQLLAGETVGIGDLPRVDDRDAVHTALSRAGASGVVTQLDRGLATPLGHSFEGGRELSGGQWQKLALGRGMMRDRPLLLMLDEPTASLDAQTESALFARYAEAARRAGASSGTITLFVSHRFSTVRMADLIIVLRNGRVIETGNHDALIAAGGLYAELFELQARAYR
jgi:ATP-binding cassette subfamily B protein